MDNQKIAKELVIMARELMALDASVLRKMGEFVKKGLTRKGIDFEDVQVKKGRLSPSEPEVIVYVSPDEWRHVKGPVMGVLDNLFKTMGSKYDFDSYKQIGIPRAGSLGIILKVEKQKIAKELVAGRELMGMNFRTKDKTFRYQLLGRLQQDAEYYLGHGNRSPKHLWSGDEESHIKDMKALYKTFKRDERPEWISWRDILMYEKQMLK